MREHIIRSESPVTISLKIATISEPQHAQSEVSPRKPIDPYRIFFPLGILFGFGGVLIWPLFYFGAIEGYWGLTHAYLQSDGFLFCFIAGFLLTALPRFTGTENPSLGSQLAIAACVVACAVALWLQSYVIAHVSFLIAYVVFSVLLAQRYRKRDRTPPETFPLIGFGVIAGLAGAVLNVLAAADLVGGGWGLAAKRSLTEGMTLMLVMGVGGFLGPRLLGFDRFNLIQIVGLESPKGFRVSKDRIRMLSIVASLLMIITIALEYGFGLGWMSIVRAAIVTIVMALTLEPWRMLVARTTLARSVWVSNLFTIIAVWVTALVPQYRTDLLHILFIGGFTLLILAIGLRVALSHGGHGLEPERRNWPLRLGLVSGSLALLSRVGAAFSLSAASQMLTSAAILWILALAFWAWRMMQLIVRTRKAM